MKIAKSKNGNLCITIDHYNQTFNAVYMILLIIFGLTYYLYTENPYINIFVIIIILSLLFIPFLLLYFFPRKSEITLNKQTKLVQYQAYNHFNTKIKPVQFLYESILDIKIVKRVSRSIRSFVGTHFNIIIQLANDKQVILRYLPEEVDVNKLVDTIKNFFNEE